MIFALTSIVPILEQENVLESNLKQFELVVRYLEVVDCDWESSKNERGRDICDRN